MSPEALARLERALAFAREHAQMPVVMGADLRALLDAYDEAMKAGQTVVECTDEMREEWAETEERLIAERDTARAEGVAAERARVVAWLRAADSETLVWFAAQRIEKGWHDKEGE